MSGGTLGEQFDVSAWSYTTPPGSAARSARPEEFTKGRI
jgi:hypothetical protein